MKVQMTFQEDWATILEGSLSSIGVHVLSSAKPREKAILFFNAVKRYITPAVRSIQRARDFSCPPQDASGLAFFEEASKRGDDLNKHLSELTLKPSYNDLMLNEWGIQHFHLGDYYQPDGWVKRTSDLLYALVVEDSVLEIGIYKHGEWANIELIEILHANWPQAIDRFRMKDAIGLSSTPSSASVDSFRKCKGKINSILQMRDGTIYAPPGMGFALDGTSLEVIQKVNKYFRGLRRLEESVESSIVEVLRSFGHTPESLPDPLIVKLVYGANDYELALPDLGGIRLPVSGFKLSSSLSGTIAQPSS